MDRKKVCEKSSAKKKMRSIELKLEIIEKHEQGVRVVDLSRQYGRSTSMICTVLKQKESISTSEIKEILGMWERISQFVEKKQPEKVATGRASDLFNDTCLTHFRNILRGRKKQTSLDMFFL
ncbi:HTH CENPB-type domain-containing protein [Nephila pilipes]|uniref:HTH CENPB-type domain-containing protein n=1 Tax=Nephila pilipes TaxID=299642 RepID=A0A8X6Q295_NEPPI|nr:HTH CENPB-type domain-containing protein [Nephila pilipes]